MKTKVKILYSDGNFQRTKPFTFSIEVRRWNDSYEMDYILETIYTTNELVARGGEECPQYLEAKLLQVTEDGQAIRAGVEAYHKIEKLVSDLRDKE